MIPICQQHWGHIIHCCSPVLHAYWEQSCPFRDLWMQMRKLRHLIEVSPNDLPQRGEQPEVSKCLLSSEKKIQQLSIFFFKSNYKDILYFYDGLYFPKQFHKFSMKQINVLNTIIERWQDVCVCRSLSLYSFPFQQIINPLEKCYPIKI